MTIVYNGKKYKSEHDSHLAPDVADSIMCCEMCVSYDPVPCWYLKGELKDGQRPGYCREILEYVEAGCDEACPTYEQSEDADRIIGRIISSIGEDKGDEIDEEVR